MPVPGENPQLDAETMVPILVGVSVVFVSVSTIVVLLRLYTRYAIVASPGVDDITIAIAQILSVGTAVTTILQAQYGLGRHIWMVERDDGFRQLKSLFASMIIYNLAQIVTKTSFLLQYRRIFQEGRTRTVCAFLIAFLAVWGVAQEILVGFACNPVSLFIPSQANRCIDSLTVWYLTSIMNIVTDFVVFMVPMPAVRGLQLRRKQKILVTSVFCLGFFTCIISIVRLFTLHSANNTTDPTWANVPSAYWSVVELNCGILCASLPPLRPLFRRLTGSGGGSASGGASPHGSDPAAVSHRPDSYHHKKHRTFASSASSVSTSLSCSASANTADTGIYPMTDVVSSSRERLHLELSVPPRVPEKLGR